MLKRTYIIYFFGILMSIWITNVNGDTCDATDVNLTLSSCKSSDFDDGKSCTLTCSVTYDDSLYAVSDMSWLYFADADSEDTNIHLFDGVSNKTTTNKTDLSLKLSSYYSGIYSCQISLKKKAGDDCDVSQNFDINLSGVNVILHETCNNASECVTFNANCNDGTCECASPYTHFYPVDVPIACFADSNANDPCNIDDQCHDGYECDNYVCACEGFVSEDIEDGSDKVCLTPVKPNHNCTYDEECQHFDSHSMCVDEYCRCTGDYADHDLDSNGHCSSGLSDAAIAGIAVGGVFALGVVAIIIRFICEKCCCSGKKKDEEDVETVEERFN